LTKGNAVSVTALVAYRPGTRGVFEACLESVFRHTPREGFELRVIHDETHTLDIEDLLTRFNLRATGYPVPEGYCGSYIHGTLLNHAVKEVQSDYLLTLDSDCFPIADGWLNELRAMVDEGAGCAGILYPWQPIPSEIMKGAIERRIRAKHCNRNTHVACQLTKTSFIFDHKIDFMDDDDTGFAIPTMAHQLGLPVKGFLVTRCGLVNPGVKFDPEFNRHVSLIFGDRIYHHGGATQTKTGYKIDRDDMFSQVRATVIEKKGAEWLLADGNSYQYKFDREEEVADFKMSITYGEMVKFLETHDRLFNSEKS
jgi:hypothetical protein